MTGARLPHDDTRRYSPSVTSSDRTERRVTISLASLSAVACLLAGAVLGYALSHSDAREARAEVASLREDLDRLAGAHQTLQERNWILYLELEQERVDRGAPPVAPAPGVFTEGVYRVGTDIKPGTYRGEVIGEFGYWARLNSTSGMVSGIVANSVVRGPFVLTINPSDVAVELRGVRITAEE